ncbi:hypothetical protein HMPREF9318_00671 [Streptococcus urinalis FB127-CNA-2]|uniref:GtrA-like protein n=1 Tax=Streptococcus urinalis 2285-97 TaxID=764291 RepID=G5KH33_9STRE|nr:GtrA family protein [Streptococcus urinalis]EHJ57400.1 GtrA-like protein [Streptococcus urinalis 2285-97]EKS22473.1 hypothetical protein HMPREF9318_00671 [Streptococcus urinalis FB127-CNA-2]VEF32286.1 GtrA-like protein [Streptococcus urinalis]
MIKSINRFMHTEVFKYLFFGVLATIVYMTVRFISFSLLREATVSATIANICAIIFAFFTNDKYVFNQAKKGWFQRFVKFVIARIFTLVLDLLLAYFLVEKFPGIIGQFVNQNIDMINAIETIIGQVLIIVLNYVFSKLFIFQDNR